MADAAVIPQDASIVMEAISSTSAPSPTLQVEPLPNPPFVFPPPSEPTLLPKTGTETSNKRPASMQLSPEGRHASNAFQRQSISALPEFSFNPAAATQSRKTSATPPASPTLSSPATPSRNGGHRRRGSEFIGGDGKTGGQTVISSSPVKDSGGLFPPGSPNKSGPTGRARHAHRRSAALSSHDLSNIMQPAASTPSLQQSSAPTTPSLTEMPPKVVERRASQPAFSSKSAEEKLKIEKEESPPPRPTSRARVGFSDTVEFIPRPLSTISSETESSISTVRGHSVSGSISSVISSSTASPQSARRGRTSLSTTFEHEQSRPKSAGNMTSATDVDVFAPQSPIRRPASFSSTNNPMFPSISGVRQEKQPQPKKKGLFGIDLHRSGPDLPKAPESPTYRNPRPSRSDWSKFGDSENISAEDWRSITEARRTSPQKKHTGKPRKVKSWANSIVPKKSKARGDKYAPLSRRPPTPSHENVPPSPTVSEPKDLGSVSFEGDFNPEQAVTIVSEPEPQPTEHQRFDLASWKPRKSPSPEGSEAISPVIDLDAALGPFGSQASPTRNAGPARRRLHSSRLTRDFVGPGMHYHRRAESAPELAPFEQDYSDRGSNSGMADVFEEEEEDDDEDVQAFSSGAPSPAIEPGPSQSEEELAGIGIQVVDADQPYGGTVMDWGVDGLGLRPSSASREPSTGHSTPTQTLLSSENLHRHQRSSSLISETILEEVSPVEVVEDHEEPRDSSQPRSSDSTVTSLLNTTLPKEPQSRMVVPPLQLSQPTLRTPASFTESSLSSPGLTPSRSSFETPRLGTATSSVTGSYRSSSFAFAEPPPIRQSIEDVPSLTSSRSTMTSAVQPQHAAGISCRTLGDRSRSSFTPSEDSAAARRRKRSSIASLSRLVGGSFGERSKLSIEQRPQTEGDDTISSQEAKQKKKKENRLSRMMHFWKSRNSTHS
ncbi:hypothetical protein EV356DRAFT_502065 [Viridothelium virens]|uniref:Cell wall proline rich protein n=1 Tax=Viridothelium virens TaxID=1048519 RepID=A0A6A6HML3_VIRVR|nr:hypothetical protein EV356DRAFT_502065 [Viridothelium virens]